MKNYYYLLICLLTTVASYSQSNFKEGLIVKANKDTIPGFISTKGNSLNPKKCIFIKNLNVEPEIYNPTNLISFQFKDGAKYSSRLVNINNENEKLFLEHLFKGNVSLYFLNYNGVDRYYILDEEGTLHELKNDEKEILRNGKTYLVESYEYRTTLSLVLYKSESVLSQLSTLPFTRKSLIEIAKKYHQDIEKNDSYHDYSGKVSKANQSFGAILGVNHISVATNDNLQNQFYYFKETLDKKATSPVLGVFYKTNFPKINRNIFLQWSSYITFINLEWNQSRQESLYHFTETNNISSKRTFWSNNLSIKYEFPGDKLQPTFQIGAFNNLEFSSEYLHEYELQDTNGVTVSTNQTTESPFSKLSLGFLLGTGIQKNIMNRKIYIDLLYQRSGMLKKFEGMNQDAFFLNIGISLIQTTL